MQDIRWESLLLTSPYQTSDGVPFRKPCHGLADLRHCAHKVTSENSAILKCLTVKGLHC